MISRTHRSTLFPYTTLFRSAGLAGTPGRTDAQRRLPCRDPAHGAAANRHHQRGCPQSLPGAVEPARRLRTDRKSTRLNSSHLGISYAVFCLKKKNKEKTAIT